MPHKHKRSRRDDDDSIHDLPPNVIAKPLAPKDFKKKNDSSFSKNNNKRKRRGGDGGAATESTAAETATATKSTSTSTSKAKATAEKMKKKRKTNQDDTPKAFLRIMQQMQGKKLDRGPDDGNDRRSKKKKGQNDDIKEEPTPAQPEKKIPIPKILPGEKLSDFAARVDQAMPLSGIAKRHNWREIEAEAGPIKKRKGHKRHVAGDESDDDPWAKLNKKVKEERKNPLETVDAPPVLTKVRPKFKVYGGAKVSVENVPGAAGSLRRREELKAERESIVEQYRRLMAEKRGGGL
ncbi:hypothetical protein AAP_03324 [Ascosphaera apis ARSEF 7405]|uniref:Urease accessory protein UreD n=1 Tax=Ascosphaera apis ARSEF 7405 TaxID=392613 RepID=A0A167YQ32_9EURO|nr:hypothetical protein AAP_03324 [Ascosphaera apis ARSEF 7405]